jgi:hypothetical protein
MLNNENCCVAGLSSRVAGLGPATRDFVPSPPQNASNTAQTRNTTRQAPATSSSHPLKPPNQDTP